MSTPRTRIDLRPLVWAVPAVVASGLVALLPGDVRPDPAGWMAGAAVLAALPCLVAGRRAVVAGIAALGVALGMLVQLRLGVPAGRLAALGAAGSVLLAAGVLAGRSPRVAGWLEVLHRRRLLALGLLGAGVLLRAVTVLGPSPAAGTLPLVPVQVGELTRYLLTAGAALALADRATGRAWAAADRRFRLVAAALVAAGAGTLVALHDLGPATLVVAGVAAAAVHARGLRARTALACIGAVLLAAPLAWSSSVVRTRVLEVADPGHQLSGALSAAWSGGLVGPGPGRSPLVDGVPAIGSDYALAALVADLGALVVTPVLLALLLAEIHLVRAAGARSGVAATLAVALGTPLAVQACWNALGAVGVLPLTGLDQPFLGVSGASLCTSAAVLGVVLGLLDRPSPLAPPAGARPLALVTGAGARAVPVLVVAAALLLAVGPRTIGDAEQLRMPRGTIWTANGDVVSNDGAAGRDHPAGALYSDLGYEHRNYAHTGVDAVEADTLTCGGRLGLADRLAGLLHPVCRPADVVTTVDSRAQAAVAAGLAGRSGEAVLLDARTGAVLALYSAPGTVPGTPPAARVRQGPPGSTMKIVTAAAALLGGVDLADAPRTEFRGSDGRALGNDGGVTCPAADVATALAQSCNSVYGWAAARVGPDELGRVARTYFGADQPFRLGGPAAAGLETGLPAAGGGDSATARTGIGQESVRSSVLGVAVATAVVATAGGPPAPWPHLVGAVCAGGDPEVPVTGPVGEPLPPSVAGPILDGMHAAVTGGTARRLAVPDGRDVAAKTGTAQLPGGGVDSWITVLLDRHLVLTLVVHEPAEPAVAVASKILRALPAPPAMTGGPSCPAASKENAA